MSRQPAAAALPRSIPLMAGWLMALAIEAAPQKTLPPVDYASQVRPILSAHCFQCHGPDEGSRKSELRLDRREEAVRPRRGRTAIVPGKPAQSEMVRRITTLVAEEAMPPAATGQPLKAEERELLRQWVAEGAPYAEHWAFRPPARPVPPRPSEARQAHNAVDQFILDRLEREGLKASPRADPHTLSRRLHLDLTGLPPTLEATEAYVKRAAVDPQLATEALVDELLASPAYGERWARVWLDLARYADSAGHGSDPLRPNLWPWRDWVIRALNRNLPYDRFIVEQIAGDLLPDATEEQQVATAFHRNSMTNTEGGTDDEEWRVAAVKDRANVTAQGLMGLTLGCAQCHSHKYDPISHREYYQFYAFFNQTEDNDQPDERPTLTLATAGDRAELTRLETALERLDKELKAQTPPAAKLKEEQERLRKARETIKPVALPVMRELPPDKRRATRVLNKGSFLDPGEPVNAGVPTALPPLPASAPTNRLGLAQWLVHRDNPLTARVAVNRYWAQLFGSGIVESEEDFGTQGTLPTHPELLDWLAVEFMETGWDAKRLLRLVVTSATYQQSSRATPELLEKDPHNRLYARATRRRLEAEAVRDQALALGGLLSRKLGGPSVFPPQPEGLWRAAFNGERTYPTSQGEDRYRRGLYTFLRRTVPYPSLATFDAPSRETCALRRRHTNTPLQAYVTLNDPVFVECAQALGRRLMREGGATVESRVRHGLRLCLGREPDDREVRTLVTLFESELSHFRAREAEARRLATEPLGPLPEKADPAEAAAWTVIGNVLLNLDGVLMKS